MRGDGSTHKAVANCSLFSSETLIWCPLFCSVWGCRIRICISLNLKQKYPVLGFLFVCFCTPPRNSPPSATSLSFSALWRGWLGPSPLWVTVGRLGTCSELLYSSASSPSFPASCCFLAVVCSPRSHLGNTRAVNVDFSFYATSPQWIFLILY